jgi:hypothetical protein
MFGQNIAGFNIPSTDGGNNPMAYIASSGDGGTHSTPRSFGARARQGLTIVVTLVVILSMRAAAAPVVATGAPVENGEEEDVPGQDGMDSRFSLVAGPERYP